MRFDRTTVFFGATLTAALAAGTVQATEPLAVGDTASAFSLPATDGTLHQLDALHGETSAILVFFRGAW